MSGGSVFVVDDNANNLSLLTGILRDAGYQVRVSNSGRRALAAVQQNPPELILLDINMPDLDGYEVCAALKRDPRSAEIPVIFLSALDDVQDKVNAFRLGGVDYITKPFQAEEVLARVASQLQLARLRGLLEARNRELVARNAALEAAQQQAELIFTTLSQLLPGTVLDGKYRLGEKIGAGGFAVVYRGEAPDGQPVAVKVLRPHAGGDDQRRRERVRVEELSAIRIRHPSAVSILDSGVTASGIAYLVMELLRGGTLGAELAARGPLSIARAAQVFLPVCAALAEAHDVGVIHRDIKPSNIFLHRDGDGERVKIVDFGIAKLGDAQEVEQATTLGRLIGTPVYMSPERLLGQPYDGRADVYALAVTMYESLAGRLPFDLPAGANLGALILTCVNEPPRPLATLVPDAPPSLAAAIDGALAKHAPARPTMAGLAAELAAITGDPVPAPPPAPPDQPTLDSPLRR